MILLVRQGLEQLTDVTDALLALLGSGVLSTFDGDPFGIPPTKAIEVVCDDDKAGYAKAGFQAAGFEVPTFTGAAHDPGDSDPVILTVTPTKEDVVKFYPIGIGPGAIMAAKALCGAYVTRPIGDNSDSYSGNDPETSIQVRCNRADIPRVKGGFAVAYFNAVPPPPPDGE
jgi:hypothetical protein